MGKGTHRLLVEQQREDWDKHYIGRNDNHLISIEDLFAKGSDELVIEATTPVAETHKSLTKVTSYTKGYWGLTVQYDSNIKQWDFTFNVKVGGPNTPGARGQFHPRAIRQRIVTQHGVEVYEKWREMVMGDWENLMEVKAAWNPPVPLVGSIACSPSSERLCKKMGFDVRSGVVFWFAE